MYADLPACRPKKIGRGCHPSKAFPTAESSLQSGNAKEGGGRGAWGKGKRLGAEELKFGPLCLDLFFTGPLQSFTRQADLLSVV